MWGSNIATFDSTLQKCVRHVAVSDCMLRSALFRDFTHDRMVEFWGLEDGIDSLYQNIDNKLPLYAA